MVCFVFQCVVTCGFPNISGRVSNDEDIPIHEGSKIECVNVDSKELITLRCLQNGSWTPDPSKINIKYDYSN